MLVMPSIIMSIADDNARAYMQWLYEEHYLLMLHTARRYARDSFKAEDIVSDSLVSLINHVNELQCKEKTALRAYIVSTVRNTAISHYRKDLSENQRFFQLEDELLSRFPSSEDIGRKISLRDELLTTLRVIHTLPDNEQLVLRMKCLDGLDNQTIAQQTGLSPESIRQYLFRARKKVRSALYAPEVTEQ